MKKPKKYAASEVIRTRTDENFLLIKEKSYHPKFDNLKSKIQLFEDEQEETKKVQTGKSMKPE